MFSEKALTLGEQLREQRWLESKQKGILLGQRMFVRNLLRELNDIELVKKVTNISSIELDELLAKEVMD